MTGFSVLDMFGLRTIFLVALVGGCTSASMSGMGFVPSLRLRGGADAAAPGDNSGMPAGFPGLPPGMNMGAMNGMFQNPAFQKMAQSLMDNPEFKQKMDDMMKNETLMKEYAKIGEQIMGGVGGAGGPQTLGDLSAGGGAGAAAGGIPGFPPMGAGNPGFEQLQSAAQNMMKDYLKPEKLTELASSDEMKELQSNPKMQEIIKDVQTNGPMSVLKYYSDPDAMAMFGKISKLLGLPDDLNKMGGDFSKMMPPGMGGMPGLPGAGAAPGGFGEDFGAPKTGSGPSFSGGAATDLE